jgi:hypothetical protein
VYKFSLEARITRLFKNTKTANVITRFIKTPVMEWKKIATTIDGVLRKYDESMTRPDKKKCPEEAFGIV